MKKDGKFFCNLCKEPIAKGKGYSFRNPNYHLCQSPCFSILTEISRIGIKNDIPPEEQKLLREQLKEFMGGK